MKAQHIQTYGTLLTVLIGKLSSDCLLKETGESIYQLLTAHLQVLEEKGENTPKRNRRQE